VGGGGEGAGMRESAGQTHQSAGCQLAQHNTLYRGGGRDSLTARPRQGGGLNDQSVRVATFCGENSAA
jgi:hypothetical protein